MTLTRFLLITSLIIGSIVAFLSFAPPQTGKWVYMWQAYVLSDDKPSSNMFDDGVYTLLPKPSEYSGIWRTWFENGELRSEEPFENGLLNGTSKYYWAHPNIANTDVAFEYRWRYNHFIGLTKWYANGNVAQIREIDQRENYTTKTFYEDGNLFLHTKRKWVPGISGKLYDSIDYTNGLPKRHICIEPVENYVYGQSGEILEIELFPDHTNEGSVLVFSKNMGIDRRAEFGIEIGE